MNAEERMAEDRGPDVGEVRKGAEGTLAMVNKHRQDPENYFTSHKYLDAKEREAKNLLALCDALEAAGERERRLRKWMAGYQDPLSAPSSGRTLLDRFEHETAARNAEGGAR